MTYINYFRLGPRNPKIVIARYEAILVLAIASLRARNDIHQLFSPGAKKPGFYEFLGWVTRNTEINPVSEVCVTNT